MSRLQAQIFSGACLVLSVLITYWLYQWGFGNAMTGHETSVWPYFIGFMASMTLVIVAIIVRSKNKI